MLIRGGKEAEMVTISIGDGSIHLEHIPEGVPVLAVRFCFFVRGGGRRSHGEATADPPPFHHLPSRPQMEVQAAVSGQI